MGSRGPLAKQEGRVRETAPTAQASQARLLPKGALEPSPRWFKRTQGAYVEYVSSPVANVIDPIDLPAVFRLFSYYDLWERLFHKWHAELEAYARTGASGQLTFDDEGNPLRDPLLGIGSGGQAVVQPILASMRQLEASIRQLEDKLGVTPQARARLGIDLSEAAIANEKATRMTRQDREDEL